MTSLPIEERKNHEIDWYFSVRDCIDKLGTRNTLKDGIPVKIKTPHSSTLTRLSNSPAVSFTATHCNDPYSELMADISLTIGREDAGTFGNPNIERILENNRLRFSDPFDNTLSGCGEISPPISHVCR